MLSITKIEKVAKPNNIEKLDVLCSWINDNCDTSIGWRELTTQSGFVHGDLIKLFNTQKHTTPMAYIRQVRQDKDAKKSHQTHITYKAVCQCGYCKLVLKTV